MPATETNSAALAKVRKICLALPDTGESLTFSTPTFKWKAKPFCYFGAESGNLSVKVGLDLQPVFLKDSRFSKTHYIGHRGWVTLQVKGKPDWEEIGELVRGSYELTRVHRKSTRPPQ